ncbi:uncharacterized protein DSM5745_03603 [Aspergillus mulundensis]|uniref:AA1-like domain-containing protein n=1 Tax=Aspergillus mulundensis TaxID=1810919 RepID=A0A3D8SL98_9EURO|nr:hypothetical protein DSM5745_03603 [Aspergillus mulundensis]RDW86961.1 hypothetical protein DSM5745_03603 [Aspergillus mulundensis]
MYFPLLTAITTITAASVAVAVPSEPNMNELGAGHTLALRDTDTISVRLDAGDDNIITRKIETQHECQVTDASDFPDGVLSIEIPDGYYCRFWSTMSCNGDSTKDMPAPGGKPSDNGLVHKTGAFKCYEGKD